MHQKILFTFVMLVMFFADIAPVHALSCAPPRLNEQIITAAPVIFEGATAEPRELTRKEKAVFKLHDLPMKGGDASTLRVFDFKVGKPWKGVAEGQTVSVLYNIYWGDMFPPQRDFLVVGVRKLDDLYWVPLCGNTVPLEHAKSQGDIAVLEKFIGIDDGGDDHQAETKAP